MHPGRYPEYAFGTRRMVLQRFPYLVVFRETAAGWKSLLSPTDIAVQATGGIALNDANAFPRIYRDGTAGGWIIAFGLTTWWCTSLSWFGYPGKGSMPPLFEWDENKARLRSQTPVAGVRGRGFRSPLAGIFDKDPARSSEESAKSSSVFDHSEFLGMFTEPLEDEIRIISARRVTKREKNNYEEYMREPSERKRSDPLEPRFSLTMARQSLTGSRDEYGRGPSPSLPDPDVARVFKSPQSVNAVACVR